jgi:hypothetical protein
VPTIANLKGSAIPSGATVKQDQFFKDDYDAMQRPCCPKCSMRMIAVSSAKAKQQPFECLRCGYAEVRQVRG